jgi:NagD protein
MRSTATAIQSWHDPDYVVVGEGRTLTLEMLEVAVRMLFDGAALIATNLDPNCPTATGIRAGCGATVAFLEKATGKKAFSVGKPSPVMMRTARHELGLATSETVVIGDTMETDILGGVQMGYRSILVLSGGTRREDLANYAYRPDIVIDSVADLCSSSKHFEDLLPPANPGEDTVRSLEDWRRLAQ